MGPSLLRDVFRYASRRAGGPSRKGFRFRRSGVSVNPPGARVKMPHGGPAGWRSVEVGLRSVSGRISSQLPASSATTRGWTWGFTTIFGHAAGVPDHFGRPRVPPSAACRGRSGERSGHRAGDVTPAPGAPPATAPPDADGCRRGSPRRPVVLLGGRRCRRVVGGRSGPASAGRLGSFEARRSPGMRRAVVPARSTGPAAVGEAARRPARVGRTAPHNTRFPVFGEHARPLSGRDAPPSVGRLGRAGDGSPAVQRQGELSAKSRRPVRQGPTPHAVPPST